MGKVVVLCHVQKMIGRKYVFSENGRLTLAKQFADHVSAYPLQTVVTDIATHDEHNSLFRDALDVFREGEVCFTLCNPYYGSEGIVSSVLPMFNYCALQISISRY